jgi:hypothetical protein
MEPEAGGRLTVGDHEVYRVMFMLDNERMVFLFTVVCQLPGEVEEWLADKLA